MKYSGSDCLHVRSASCHKLCGGGGCVQVYVQKHYGGGGGCVQVSVQKHYGGGGGCVQVSVQKHYGGGGGCVQVYVQKHCSGGGYVQVSVQFVCIVFMPCWRCW